MLRRRRRRRQRCQLPNAHAASFFSEFPMAFSERFLELLFLSTWDRTSAGGRSQRAAATVLEASAHLR